MISSESARVVSLSVVVPFHRNLTQLAQCLAAVSRAVAALRARSAHGNLAVTEVLVVADGAIENTRELAAAHGAHVLAIEGPHGPAAARNRGAEIVRGDVLVFIDSDVVIREDALSRLAERLSADSGLDALFGAYDETPAHPGFFSQCRNLSHSYIHQRARGDIDTFWAGLGAVRRDVFLAASGFDERFTRPSVEDIDLGYRLRARGHRIVIDPDIQGTHLKQWTLRSSIRSDIIDRGIPWTQLLRRYRGGAHLNVSMTYRLCVVTAYLACISAAAAIRWPWLLAAATAGLLTLFLLDRAYYRFFAQRRGVAFMLAWFPFHVLHHLCNGASFVTGTLLVIAIRSGLPMPGALPVAPWPTVAGSLRRASFARS